MSDMKITNITTGQDDGSVVIARVSQTLGLLYMQTELGQDEHAARPAPDGDLSENIRVLPLWQLQSMLDEVSHTRRELDRVATRLGLVEVMIREQASGVMNYDPMAAEPIRDYPAEAQAAARDGHEWNLRTARM